MSRSYLAFGAMACLALSSNAFVAAQQGQREKATREEAGGVQSQTTVRRSSMVIGGTVSLKGGYEVGKIEDFIIDEGGCISMVVVTYGENYIAVPWTISTFDFNQRVFVLDIERSRLAQVPTFTDFKVVGTADFRGRVNTFFGVRVRERNGAARPTDREETPRSKAQPSTETTPKQPGTTTPGTTPKPAPPRGTQPGSAKPPRKGESPNPGAKPTAPKGESPKPGTKPTAPKGE